MRHRSDVLLVALVVVLAVILIGTFFAPDWNPTIRLLGLKNGLPFGE